MITNSWLYHRLNDQIAMHLQTLVRTYAFSGPLLNEMLQNIQDSSTRNTEHNSEIRNKLSFK